MSGQKNIKKKLCATTPVATRVLLPAIVTSKETVNRGVKEINFAPAPSLVGTTTIWLFSDEKKKQYRMGAH